MDRGLVVGQNFARGVAHKLKLDKRQFSNNPILKSNGSINNADAFYDASYNPQENISMVQPQNEV